MPILVELFNCFKESPYPLPGVMDWCFVYIFMRDLPYLDLGPVPFTFWHSYHLKQHAFTLSLWRVTSFLLHSYTYKFNLSFNTNRTRVIPRSNFIIWGFTTYHKFTAGSIDWVKTTEVIMKLRLFASAALLSAAMGAVAKVSISYQVKINVRICLLQLKRQWHTSYTS